MRNRFGSVLLWALVVLFSITAADLFGQTVRPASSVMAVDAEDRMIGEVLRADMGLRQLQVAIEVEGELVVVLVGRDTFSHAVRNAVYFESGNCTGAPYLDAMDDQAEPFGRAAAVVGPRGTLYFGFPGSVQVRRIGSVLRGSSCRPYRHDVSVIYAERKVDLADQFVPPFRIVSDDRRGPLAKGPHRVPSSK